MRTIRALVLGACMLCTAISSVARAETLYPSTYGIVLLKERPSDSDGHINRAMYFTKIDRYGGNPLVDITETSGKVTQVEAWYIGPVLLLDGCLTRAITDDQSFAFIKSKAVEFESARQRFPAVEKVLGPIAAELANSVKQYTAGYVKPAGTWMTKAAYSQMLADTERHNKAHEEKLRAQRAMLEAEEKLRQAKDAPSPARQKSRELMGHMTETVLPVVGAKGSSFDQLLTYLQFNATQLNSKAAFKFKVVISDATAREKLDSAVIDLDLRYVPLYETLKHVASLTGLQFRVQEDTVLFAEATAITAFARYYEVEDWKQEAMRVFPALRTKGSALHRSVGQAISARSGSESQLFSRPDWPMLIASGEAAKLGVYPDQSQRNFNDLEYNPASEKGGAFARGGSGSKAGLAKQSYPSCVTIYVFDKRTSEPLGHGSGFVVAPGIIATNEHCVEDASADQLDVKFVGSQKLWRVRRILAVNKEQDVALLRIDNVEAPALPLKVDPLPEIGDNLFVIGCPRGYEGTFSTGIVSAIREKEHGQDRLQMTAPISPGSSGGPVMNESGEVVGVSVSGRIDGQALNFAVLARHVQALLDAIEP